MVTDDEPTAERSPGRPRDPAVDRAILEAALEALLEQGFAAMSIEAVARSAGVGKTAIYRRYPSKLELAADAVRSVLHLDELPETGDTRRDLATWLNPPGDILGRAIGFIGSLLAEEREHPELIGTFRERVARPRIAQARTIIRAGIERGEVRADVDAEAVSLALLGSVIARHLSGLPAGEEELMAAIDLLWQGIAAD